MIITLNTTTGNAVLNAIKAALDADGVGAKINLYTGTKPASPEAALSGNTLLGTLTCSYPCGTVASKTLTFSGITQDSSADNSGTAAWARITTGGGSPVSVIDVDVSTTGGSGYLKMNSTTVIAGGPIVITSMTLSV